MGCLRNKGNVERIGGSCNPPLCQFLECHIPVDKLIPGLLIKIFILHFRNVKDFTRSILNLRPKISVEVHERCGVGQSNNKTKKGECEPPLCQLSDLHKSLVGTDCLVDKPTHRTLRISNHLLQRSNKTARILCTEGVLLIIGGIGDVHLVTINVQSGDSRRIKVEFAHYIKSKLTIGTLCASRSRET